MARVQYGTIVTELKGKVAGQVFQRGSTGFVLRNKNSRKGSDSLIRSASARLLTRVSSSWRDLTDEERTQWSGGAVNWPFVDKFGVPYTGSGYQYYMAFNRNRLQIGLAMVTAPVSPVSGNIAGELVFSPSTSSLVVTWEELPGVDSSYIVYATAPYPASRKFFTRPYYFMDFDTDQATGLVFLNKWVSLFGTPIVGARIDVLVKSVANAFPKNNAESSITAVVVA